MACYSPEQQIALSSEDMHIVLSQWQSVQNRWQIWAVLRGMADAKGNAWSRVS